MLSLEAILKAKHLVNNKGLLTSLYVRTTNMPMPNIEITSKIWATTTRTITTSKAGLHRIGIIDNIPAF